jgi:hypothetical protein
VLARCICIAFSSPLASQIPFLPRVYVYWLVCVTFFFSLMEIEESLVCLVMSGAVSWGHRLIDLCWLVADPVIPFFFPRRAPGPSCKS